MLNSWSGNGTLKSNDSWKLPLLKENVDDALSIQNEDPNYLFPRGNKPLLYHQNGNINFFSFITNQ